MAEFPSYVCIAFDGYGESFDPSVESTEMERGVPKERLLNSQVMMKVAASLIFKSAADIESFLNWYFNTIQRIGWFTMTHPRTGQTITAKFPGGDIGTLVPLAPAFGVGKRDLTIQYLR